MRFFLDVGGGSEGVAGASCLVVVKGCNCNGMTGDLVVSCLNGGKVFWEIGDAEVAEAEGSGVILVVSDGVGRCCNCCS